MGDRRSEKDKEMLKTTGKYKILKGIKIEKREKEFKLRQERERNYGRRGIIEVGRTAA